MAWLQVHDGLHLLDFGHDDHLLLLPDTEGLGKGEVVAKRAKKPNIIVGYLFLMIMFNSCAF